MSFQQVRSKDVLSGDRKERLANLSGDADGAIGNVCVAVWVQGNRRDEGANFELPRCQAVADDVELGLPGQSEDVRFLQILVAFHVPLR